MEDAAVAAAELPVPLTPINCLAQQKRSLLPSILGYLFIKTGSVQSIPFVVPKTLHCEVPLCGILP